MSDVSTVSPTLADAESVRSYMEAGLACSDVDRILGKPSEWARKVMVWWWQLPAEEGGMPDFDADEEM